MERPEIVGSELDGPSRMANLERGRLRGHHLAGHLAAGTVQLDLDHEIRGLKRELAVAAELGTTSHACHWPASGRRVVHEHRHLVIDRARPTRGGSPVGEVAETAEHGLPGEIRRFDKEVLALEMTGATQDGLIPIRVGHLRR